MTDEEFWNSVCRWLDQCYANPNWALAFFQTVDDCDQEIGVVYAALMFAPSTSPAAC
jgi:hypothetical protein